MEQHNKHLQEKYRTIAETETRWEEIMTEDAEYILVAFGLASRVCHKTIQLAREKGFKAGLLRPITLWPFPSKRIDELAKKTKLFLTVELNSGQMVEDVRLAVNGKANVEFYGRMGGMIPTPEEILNNLENFIFKYHVN
jgi:2-oxoglutarate ferredoxin oxidoreductase subunit alpha